MDCCNYVPYRHHQPYYGAQQQQYFQENFPGSYHGEFYNAAGHVYHDYYGTSPYYPPQHWQGFVQPDYVYNPKEARLRKAMRDANRERLIGCNSSMLQRPSARRATTAGPHSWLPQGSHEEQMMMPIRCPSTASASALEPPSPCFPEGGGAGSPAPPAASAADQYMAMTANGYHRRQHHSQRRSAPELEAQGAAVAAAQPRNHDGYMQDMQPNPLAQLQQQTEMWPGFQNDMRAPRSSPYLLQEPYHHHHHHPQQQQQQQAPSPMGVPSPILHQPHLPLTPPQAHHPVMLTPPHSNENVPPPVLEEGGAKGYEGKQHLQTQQQAQLVLEQTMQQPLMETNNLQQNQAYVTSYAPSANHYEKAQEETQSKKAAPSSRQPYPRRQARPKALPDFNEAFGSTERGRFQSPPDPNSAPNKRLLDFFFEDAGGAPRFDDFQM